MHLCGVGAVQGEFLEMHACVAGDGEGEFPKMHSCGAGGGLRKCVCLCHLLMYRGRQPIVHV